jgi:LPXTG-motif cell wall-anchored protein
MLGASLLASSPAAHAAPGEAYVQSDVQCDANHNGVLDLTLINNQQSQAAVFVVAATGATASSTVAVPAASASAITFTDLPDGSLTVPVSVDGVDAGVAVRVACDAPEVAVLGAPLRSQAAAPSLPATGRSSTGGLIIGSALVLAGIAASLVARRRYF